MTCDDILINLLLAFVGVVAALWYENLGSPRLRIEDSITTDDERDEMGRARFLHLTVNNNPRRVPFVPRQTAMGVHGSVEFLDNGRNSISGKMPIRWDGAPEPFKYEIMNGKVVTLTDPRLFRVSRFIDIYPDEQESLGVAIRLEGDDNAYGWTTQSYFHSWRHPDFEIPSGNFYARVTVKSGSEISIRDVPFTNPSEIDEFDLLTDK